MPQPARQLILGAIVFLVQWLVLWRLQIFAAYPEIVLLFVAWLGIRNGRLSGSAGGFVLGFLLDAVYQTWGIHMFVKTLVGFLVGLFPANERETLLIQPRQAFLGDRKSTRLNSSHVAISYAVFCLKIKIRHIHTPCPTVH